MNFLKKRKKKHVSIGIIAPNNNIICRKIEAGIISTFQEANDLLFGFSVIECNDDLGKLMTKVDSYLANMSFDVLLTLGKSATQIAKFLTEAKRLYTPIVFGGVVDPLGSGLIQSYDYTGNHLTGVAAFERDYECQVRNMVKIFNCGSKPAISRILVLYNPEIATDMRAQDMENFERVMASYGTLIIPISFKDPSTIYKSLQQLSNPKTVVMTLRDNSATSNIYLIIEACNKLKLPLFTSDLESTKLGAAVGIGDCESRTGISLGKKALDLLRSQKMPSLLPITRGAWGHKYELNRTAAREQGLHLNDHLEVILRELNCSFV